MPIRIFAPAGSWRADYAENKSKRAAGQEAECREELSEKALSAFSDERIHLDRESKSKPAG